MTARAIAGMTVAALLAGAAAPPAERVVTGDAIVPVTLNGTDARLRIDPGAPGVPLIDAALAARLGLKGGGMLGLGLGYAVGPETVYHRSKVVAIRAGGDAFKRRVGWAARAYAPVADGTIGPGDLPEPVIRFVFRAAEPSERTAVLPMVDGGGPFGGFFGLYAQIMVGGQPMRVRFDPYHARTLANAGAALRLAAAQDGRLSGDTLSTEIAFGIERPVRTLVLARPLQLGPLSIARLGARTNDDGNANRIRDADATPENVDPEEIVVVAKGKRRDPNRDRLSLGADQLGRCSSLVFDKSAKQIRLTCL